jgi:hypothetical protein
MHLNKLVTHLKQLDKAQLKRFGEFVHSPYFKVPSSPVALFDYLQTQHPTFDEKKISPALIARKVKDLPTENKQAKAGTELLKNMELFLATEKWHSNPRTVMLDMLAAQNQLQWQALYADNLEKLQTELHNDAEKNIDYFHQKHLLATIESNGYNVKIKRNAQNDLSPVLKTLDEYYALKKLRYHCELLSRNQILGTPYQANGLAQALDILTPYNNISYPYVYLFTNVYQLLSADTYEQATICYNRMKEYIATVEVNGITTAVAESIEYMDSVSMRWFNSGYIEAGKESLWCTELRIKHGHLLEQKKITPILFRNTVSLAVLTGKEPKWINYFIETFGPNLPAQAAETNLAFAKAQYYHYTKNHKQALRLYQQAQVKEEPVFNAVVRRWQFMCLYEQNPNDKALLFDFLVAFETYLKRNTEALHQFKPTFLLVINYSKKLLSANNKQARNKAITELNNEPYFAGKPWLLEHLKTPV